MEAIFAFGTGVLVHPAIPMIAAVDTKPAVEPHIDFMLSLFRSFDWRRVVYAPPAACCANMATPMLVARRNPIDMRYASHASPA